jgi:hypothetical protein
LRIESRQPAFLNRTHEVRGSIPVFRSVTPSFAAVTPARDESFQFVGRTPTADFVLGGADLLEDLSDEPLALFG